MMFSTGVVRGSALQDGCFGACVLVALLPVASHVGGFLRGQLSGKNGKLGCSQRFLGFSHTGTAGLCLSHSRTSVSKLLAVLTQLKPKRHIFSILTCGIIRMILQWILKVLLNISKSATHHSVGHRLVSLGAVI